MFIIYMYIPRLNLIPLTSRFSFILLKEFKQNEWCFSLPFVMQRTEKN